MFFINNTATTEIYTLSLHDALPICVANLTIWRFRPARSKTVQLLDANDDATHKSPLSACRITMGICGWRHQDRKSTRLNSSHSQISYAVFCSKKKIHADSHLRQAGQ